MDNIVFETERLYFRKFRESDELLIYSLNSDPAVTKYTHDPMESYEQARNVLLQVIMPQYDLYNFGRWAVFKKSNDTFLGWCGLKYVTEPDEVDLGYRFIKSFWGQGYATEATLATIKYGMDVLQVPCITGRALPENKASIKVMEKCGMANIGIFQSHGFPAVTFKINNANRQL